MESLLEPVELNQETTQALDEIRSGADNALYGTDSADAEEKVNDSVLPLIEGSGLPSLHVMHYRWYLRELARHWRSRKGRDLAFHLELCVRKWVHLGLEPRTLQFLICEAHQRLKGTVPDCGAPGAGDCPQSPVDVRSLETAKNAKAEPDGDMTEIGSEISDRVPSPETQSAESPVSLRDPSTPLRSAQGDSASSAKSVDVRSGSGPDTGPLESSTPGPLGGKETAKAAKNAKVEEPS